MMQYQEYFFVCLALMMQIKEQFDNQEYQEYSK